MWNANGTIIHTLSEINHWMNLDISKHLHWLDVVESQFNVGFPLGNIHIHSMIYFWECIYCCWARYSQLFLQQPSDLLNSVVVQVSLWFNPLILGIQNRETLLIHVLPWSRCPNNLREGFRGLACVGWAGFCWTPHLPGRWQYVSRAYYYNGSGQNCASKSELLYMVF